MYHPSAVLDNPSETRRSYASTAFRDEPGRELDIPADLTPLADDTARCEAAAVTQSAKASIKFIECEGGIHTDHRHDCPPLTFFWVAGPRTGRVVRIAQDHWGRLMAFSLIEARRATAQGGKLKLSVRALQQIADLDSQINSARSCIARKAS